MLLPRANMSHSQIWELLAATKAPMAADCCLFAVNVEVDQKLFVAFFN